MMMMMMMMMTVNSRHCLLGRPDHREEVNTTSASFQEIILRPLSRLAVVGLSLRGQGWLTSARHQHVSLPGPPRHTHNVCVVGAGVLVGIGIESSVNNR